MLEQVATHNVSALTFIVLNMTLGIDPLLIGVVATIHRLWDAIVDPAIGETSDNVRTRWGRRKPFMFVGIIFSAIFLVAIWLFPRDWSPNAQLVWYFVAAICLYTASSVYIVPHTAMGYEMTPDYHERTRVLSYRLFFMTLISLAGGWSFWLVSRPIFSDTLEGARWLSIGMALIIIVVGSLPLIYCRERQILPNTRVEGESALGTLWKNMRQSLGNKSFQRVLLAQVLITLCTSSILTLGDYINVYYMADGDKSEASIYRGWASTAFTLSLLAATPVVVKISTIIGKRRTLLFSLVLQLLGATSKYWCYSNEYPVLIIVPALLYGPALASMGVLSASMIADICDDDELQYGTRREGMFAAAMSWCTKMAHSLSALFAGLLVKISGFDATLGAAQPPGAVDAMRVFFGFLPAVGIILAFVLLKGYSISEQSAFATRLELERRKPSPIR